MVRYILCFNHVYYHSEINKIEVLLICFANQEIITDTGNRDQVFLATPLGLFSNFSWAAANHFLCKNLRNLRSGILAATVACRYLPSTKRRSQYM